MNVQIILQLIGLAVLIVLIIQIVWQFKRIRRGGHPLGTNQALLNYFLLILLIVCFGSAGYVRSQATTNVQPDQTVFCKQVQVKDHHVAFSFTVPHGAKFALYHNQELLANVDNSGSKHSSTLHYVFQSAGTYRVREVIAGHRYSRVLKVNPGKATSSAKKDPAKQSSQSTQHQEQAPTAQQPQSQPSGSQPAMSNDGAPSGYHYEYRTVRVPVTGNTAQQN